MLIGGYVVNINNITHVGKETMTYSNPSTSSASSATNVIKERMCIHFIGGEQIYCEYDQFIWDKLRLMLNANHGEEQTE